MALRPSATWWLLSLSLLITLSTAQIQQGGPCPAVESTKDLELAKFMGRWFETMQTYRADGVINECTQYIFQQVSNSNNFTFDSFARNPKTKMDIFSQGVSMVGIDSNGYSVFEIMDNGLKISVHILDTDYTNFAVLWACIPAENSHYENAVVLTRERNPSLELLYMALDIMSARNITTSFLVSVEHRNCPSRWTTPKPSQGTSSSSNMSSTLGFTSSTMPPQTTENPNVNSTIVVSISYNSTAGTSEVSTETPSRTTVDSSTNMVINSTTTAPSTSTNSPLLNTTTVTSSTNMVINSTTTAPSTSTESPLLNFTSATAMPSTEQTTKNPLMNSTAAVSTTISSTSLVSMNITTKPYTTDNNLSSSTVNNVTLVVTSTSNQSTISPINTGAASTTGAQLSTWTPTPILWNTTTSKGTSMIITSKSPTIPTPPPSVRSVASKAMGQFLQILFCWLIIEFLISYKLTGSWI